jgi:hypothetical protein
LRRRWRWLACPWIGLFKWRWQRYSNCSVSY